MKKETILHGLKQAIFYSAIVHIVLLFIFATKTKDIEVLNYFDILDIELFIPRILSIPHSTVLSFIFFLLLWLGFAAKKR